jgi:hypothetical protein
VEPPHSVENVVRWDVSEIPSKVATEHSEMSGLWLIKDYFAQQDLSAISEMVRRCCDVERTRNSQHWNWFRFDPGEAVSSLCLTNSAICIIVDH